MQFLQQRLPDAVRAIGDRLFAVAGVLDNEKGDYERLVIFLVVHRENSHAIGIKGPAGADQDFLWTSYGFDVDEQGRIVGDSSMSDAAAYNVQFWYPRSTYRGPLVITNRETGESDIFELTSESITRTAAPN